MQRLLSGALGIDVREFLVEHIAHKKGSADLVAYFFLRAAELLRPGGTCGLIATKTISEGKTREVGLDQLLRQDIVIYRAIRSRPWPGSANLHVAQLWFQQKPAGEIGPVLDGAVVRGISSQLRPVGRVTGQPVKLAENGGRSYQGSIVLGMGFVLSEEEAVDLLSRDPKYSEVVKPFANGEDVNSRPDSSPSRWVIDFFDRSEEEARRYPDAWAIIEERVRPERQRTDARGQFKLRKPLPQRYWQYAEKRPGLYGAIRGDRRVLVCSEVTKHLNFSWMPNGIVYSANLDVFPGADDHLFGVLQSARHEGWARRYSAHLETRLKYSCGNAFETFPQPRHISSITETGRELRLYRDQLRQARRIGLTALYNLVHDPGVDDVEVRGLRDLHRRLDEEVAAAYDWSDVALGHAFHETDWGERYTISNAAREEILDRLL